MVNPCIIKMRIPSLAHPQGGGLRILPAQPGGASPVGGLGSHLKRWFLSMSGNPQGFQIPLGKTT